MSDIRKFLQGSQKREEERKKERLKTQTEKRKLSQKNYDKNEELFCNICRQFPESSDKDSSLVKSIKENYRKFHKSAKHINCIE